jgi:hypothetical protein
VTDFPLSAACFCFFLAGIPPSRFAVSHLEHYVTRIGRAYLSRSASWA